MTSVPQQQLGRTADRLIAARTPFAIVALPGEEAVLYGADDGCVAFIPWASPYAARLTLATARKAPAPWTESTPEAHYRRAVADIVAAHTPESGKTVLSRAICRSAGTEFSWGAAAAELFGRFPDTFRYIVWSEATGGWMGATPELLARIDGRRLDTMALAGTRAADCPGWDTKNCREHAMVTAFIAETLRAAGAEVSTGVTGTLPYGAISHMHTPVAARLAPGTDVEALLDSLSPTPAVAGLPRDEAVERIGRLERHKRRLYAGYIELRRGACRYCYVNLRCLNFDPADGAVCIYAGGGVTALSDAGAEWTEAERKARPLNELFDHL